MDLHRARIGFVVIALFAALAGPALAGGWAAVRLDEPPGDVVANEPWQFGFMVMQHDLSPNSDVTPVLRAQHRQTGEEITATGRQEGATGHFVAEVIFPRAGEWKWSIEPQPFPETSFETLLVREVPAASRAFSAHVVTGTCAAPEDVAFALGDVEPLGLDTRGTASPLAVRSSTIETPLPTLVKARYAIAIATSASDGDPVACGDIAGAASGDSSDVVLGLQSSLGTRHVGVAVLRDEDDRTAVTLYLLTPNLDLETISGAQKTAAAEETKTIEILDGWVFQPANLDARVGDNVTWVNNSPIAHTVSFDDLDNDDSGLIDPGESFTLTFDEPGTYHYRCAPHPGMAGVIVVV